jgi:hypothetical protein
MGGECLPTRPTVNILVCLTANKLLKEPAKILKAYWKPKHKHDEACLKRYRAKQKENVAKSIFPREG